MYPGQDSIKISFGIKLCKTGLSTLMALKSFDQPIRVFKTVNFKLKVSLYQRLGPT